MLGIAIALPVGFVARADDRFNVCSITINSDDEIRTLRNRLPASSFRFTELTDTARTSTADPGSSWFGRACDSGVSCDVLVVSGHFGNTWAGDYGTTFAGTSGLSLSLEELERRRCDASCPGILGNPREVFLFGCKTLADSAPSQSLPTHDAAVFAEHAVVPAAAARFVDAVTSNGEVTSSRERMELVFAGVPRVYGFTEVAPAGKRVAPLLDKYLLGVGDYAEHLRRLERSRTNELLAHAMEPTCFAQTTGVDPAGAAFAREQRVCALRSEHRSVSERVEQVAHLFDTQAFLADLPAIGFFLRSHQRALADPAYTSSLVHIRQNIAARSTVAALVHDLQLPVVRLELVRIARAVGWLSAEEARPIQRQIAVSLLRPPVWGEARDSICGLGRDVLDDVDVHSEEIAAEVYRSEFGIQALACLKPADPRVRERLAASLDDSREWIRRLAASAIAQMDPLRLAAKPSADIR
jgi:hypothetical protein